MSHLDYFVLEDLGSDLVTSNCQMLLPTDALGEKLDQFEGNIL